MHVFHVTFVGVSCLLLCGFLSLPWVVRLGSKCSCPPNHPASPQLNLRKIILSYKNCQLVDCQVYFSNLFLLDFRTDNLHRT